MCAMGEVNSLLMKIILNNKSSINTAISFWISACYLADFPAPWYQLWWHQTIHAEPPGWVHVSCTNSIGAYILLHQLGILCINWYDTNWNIRGGRMKLESYHDASFVITSPSRGCHNDNFHTVHHPARVTIVNLAKMAETVAPLREVLYDLTAFIHRICRQYFVC